MKKTIILGLLILIFITGCGIQGNFIASSEPSVELTSLNTDKELYHSGEMIHIAFNINSQTVLNNVSIRFYGIYSRIYRLDQTKIVDLIMGENTITLDYQAPRCYGCSGISPGTYQITADVIYNNEILTNNSISIEIRQ